MLLTLRKPQTWPYAAGSTGRPRGALPLGSRSILVFEAVGEARDAYNNRVSKAIIGYLNANAHQLRTSGRVILLSFFMMGRSPEKTKPMVMFVSEDETARTEAFSMINKSGIMKEFPGFEIGHMDLKAESEHLQVLGSESSDSIDCASTPKTGSENERPEVFARIQGLIAGTRLQVSLRNGNEETLSHAVAGGVIHHEGNYYLHTVGHFLSRTDTIDAEPPDIVASSTAKDTSLPRGPIGWDATGLSDFDDSGDDEVEDELVQATSRGSATPESNASEPCSVDSGQTSPQNLDKIDEDIFSAELALKLEELTTDLSIDKHLNHVAVGEGVVRVGRVAMLDKRLDSALIELDTGGIHTSEVDLGGINTVPLSEFSDSASPPPTTDCPIKVLTPEGGTIGGALSATCSFIRMPHSGTFEVAHVAKLARPLAPGDCGTWVRDATTDKVLGYVVAGSPTTGLTVLLPAKNIADTFSTKKLEDNGSFTRPSLSRAASTTESVTTCSQSRQRRIAKDHPHLKDKTATCSLEVDEPRPENSNCSRRQQDVKPLLAITISVAAFFLILNSLAILTLLFSASEPTFAIGVLAEIYSRVPWQGHLSTISGFFSDASTLIVCMALPPIFLAAFTTREAASEMMDCEWYDLTPNDASSSTAWVMGIAQLLITHSSASGVLSRVWRAVFRLFFLHGIPGILAGAGLACYLAFSAAAAVKDLMASRCDMRRLNNRPSWAAPKSGGDKNYFEHIFQGGWRMLPNLFFGIMFLVFGNLSGNALQFGIYTSSLVDETGGSRLMTTTYAVIALTIGAMLNWSSRHVARLPSKLERAMGSLKMVIILGMVIALLMTSLPQLTSVHLVRSWAKFAVALSFLANVSTETNNVTSFKKEIAKEGVLPYSLFFTHETATRPLRGPFRGSAPATPSMVLAIFSWAFNVLLVLFVGAISTEKRLSYSFQTQILSSLMEALLKVLLSGGLSWLLKGRKRNNEHRGLSLRICGVLAGSMSSFGGSLDRVILEQKGHYRIQRRRVAYVEALDDEGPVQTAEFVDVQKVHENLGEGELDGQLGAS
ncbi:hypothetical protein OQA88_5500 [Cercophora sp. LCS_1]